MSNPAAQVQVSEQRVLAQSFDQDFNQLTVELLGYDSGNNVLRRVLVDSNGNLTVSGGGGGGSTITNLVGITATGQESSASSLPVVIASDQPPIPITGSITATADTPPANNTYGSVTSIAVNATATLVDITSTPAGFKIRGFEGQGDADGQFWIEINGSKKYFGRVSATDKTFVLTLPNPDAVTTGSQVTLKVINEGEVTAGLYEGVLFAE